MAFTLALESLDKRLVEAQPLAAPLAIDELPTPALLLNEKILDANITKMAEHLSAHNKGFRPHGKTHKCPIIARKQMAAGAVGVCTAKLSEAYVFANAGLNDILVTSPVGSNTKAWMVGEVARRANALKIVVDNMASLQLIREQIGDDTKLGIVVDVDVAMGRTGTRDLDTVLRLASFAAEIPNFEFCGLQQYAGHLMHIESFAERRDKSLALWEEVATMREALAARGMTPKIVSGGGTGTYNIDSDVACVTDLQVGSYVVMDQEYRLINGKNSELFEDFEVALTLAATGISQPLGQRAFTVDGGFKSFASDTVAPEPIGLPGAKFRFGGDEHGIVILPKQPAGANAGTNSYIGTVHQFITPHCDPTINLHDFLWVHDGEMVYEAWPIAARGCAW